MPLFKNRAYNPALGVRQKKQLAVNIPVLPPGAVIRATDRNYITQPNGSWTRVDREDEVPHTKSMIYLAHTERPDPARWQKAVTFKTTH